MQCPVKLQHYILEAGPEEHIYRVRAYNPNVRRVMDSLSQQIRSIDRKLRVAFLGSSFLGIAGAGDLDIDVLCSAKNFQQYVQRFIDMFGQPVSREELCVHWNFRYQGYWVDLFLTEAHAQAITELLTVYHTLKRHKGLLKEYEQMKIACDGKPYCEYQARKYKFHKKVLEIFWNTHTHLTRPYVWHHA